jgi:hypothetical protein
VSQFPYLIATTVRDLLIADLQTAIPLHPTDLVRVKTVTLDDLFADPNDYYPYIRLTFDDIGVDKGNAPEIHGSIFEWYQFRLDAEYHDLGTKEDALKGISTLWTRIRNCLSYHWDLGGLTADDGSYVVGVTTQIIGDIRITLGGGPDDEWRPHITCFFKYTVEKALF